MRIGRCSIVATRKEVARRAGVSEATVSRVFNGVGPMKEATRERVLRAAEELQYYPNAVAQNFARRKSGNLGVILPYVPKIHLLSTYYFSEILSGIGDRVRDQGYDLLLLFRRPEEQADYVRYFRSRKVDACVILGARDADGERAALRQLREQGLPFCLLNQHYAGEPFPVVDADHVQGSRLAIKHLLERGCRRIAFLNGPPEYSNSLDRLAGCRQALEEEGLQLNPGLLFYGNYSHKSGYEAAAAIYERIGEIDGIFAANDRMAIGLMQGLKERGVRPGRDVAVVGYDDSDAAKLADPALTTVHVPLFEMGRRAVDRALDQLEHGSLTFHEKLDTRIVVRQSCGWAG